MKRILCLIIPFIFICSCAAFGEEMIRREETVYVICGADGSANRVISSVRLRNYADAEETVDLCDLDNIEIVKGNAAFTREGSELTWRTGGEDVFYRGDGKAPLPVTVRVSYALDGESVSPNELPGKSGRVVIRFDYEAATDVPFLMITGALLDDARFRNVNVTSGACLDDGSRLIAVGVAAVGLDNELIDLPNYVEISADATDFSLLTTLTAATCEVFGRLPGAIDEASVTALIGKLSGLPDIMLQTILKSSCDPSDLLPKLNALIAALPGIESGVSAANKSFNSANPHASALNADLNDLQTKTEALCAALDDEMTLALARADAALARAGIPCEMLTIENYAALLTALPPSDEITALREGLDELNALCAQARDAQTALDCAITDASALNLALTDAQTALSEAADLLSAQTGTIALLANQLTQKALVNIKGNLTEAAQAFDAALTAARAYQSYSGLREGLEGAVRFVFTTASIE